MSDERKTASSTYKTLFLEKIFGGMKGRYRNFRNKQSDEKKQRTEDWLDIEFRSCANSKQEEIKMILNSMAKSSDKKLNADDLASEFLFMINNNWIKQLYGTDDQKSEEYKELHEAFEFIRGFGKFRTLLDKLAEEVLDDLGNLNADRESVQDEDDD